jgi:rare lipoprotein A
VKKILPPSNSSQGGHYKVGSPYKIKGKWYRPREDYNLVQTGIASWYGPQFHGKQTANGEIFDMYEVTAAHKTLQLPSIVEVTNLENGRSLVVRVNDRGPYKRGRIIDLSKKAATLLGFKDQGTAKVRIRVLEEESRKVAAIAKQGGDSSGYVLAANKALLKTDLKIKPVIVEAVLQNPLDDLKPNVVEAVLNSTISDPKRLIPEAKIYVQAGSFSMYENAVNLRDKLENLANVSILPTNINGKKMYRVRLNANDVKQADYLLAKLTANGNNNAMIVVD